VPPEANAASASRDIAAEQARQQKAKQRAKQKVKQKAKQTPSGGADGGAAARPQVPGSQGGGDAALLTSLTRKMPLSAVHMSQVFSVLGALVLVALWSVTRRRRSGVAANVTPGRRFARLPLFWPQTERGRLE
jgi:cobalamin biosynthesis Mg chelatase CobN